MKSLITRGSMLAAALLSTGCANQLEGRWAGRLQCGSAGSFYDVDFTLETADKLMLVADEGTLGFDFDAGNRTTILDSTYNLDVRMRDRTGQQELEVDMECLTYLLEVIDADGTVTTPRDECLPDDYRDAAMFWNGEEEIVMEVDGCEGTLQPVGN